MDLGKAVVLMGLVYALVEYLKTYLPADIDPRITQTLVFLIGVGCVFLVAETVWGKDQVIGDHVLSDLDFWSKLVVGLFVGAGATVGHRVESAVRSVGSSEQKPGKR